MEKPYEDWRKKCQRVAVVNGVEIDPMEEEPEPVPSNSNSSLSLEQAVVPAERPAEQQSEPPEEHASAKEEEEAKPDQEN